MKKMKDTKGSQLRKAAIRTTMILSTALMASMGLVSCGDEPFSEPESVIVIPDITHEGNPSGSAMESQAGKETEEHLPQADYESNSQSPGDNGSTSNGSPPQVLTFMTDTDRITSYENILFTVVVTDPDGIDDLIGGTLTSPDGKAFGAFATAAQEGAYTASVSWSQFQRMQPIEFISSLTRKVIATFYDVSGNSVQVEYDVSFHCDGLGACDGECTNLSQDDSHCGECNRTCEYDEIRGTYAYCNNGLCTH